MDRDGYPIKPIHIDWEEFDDKSNPNRLRLQISGQQIVDRILDLPPEISLSLVVLMFGFMFIANFMLKLDSSLSIGFVLVCCGVGCLIFTTYNTTAAAIEENGLLFYAPRIVTTVLQETSIHRIFEFIRNYRGFEGMPDFVMSQVLPLSNREREEVWDSLPAETQRFIQRSDVFMYPMSPRIRNLLLPRSSRRRDGIPSPMSVTPRRDDHDGMELMDRQQIFPHPIQIPHVTSYPRRSIEYPQQQPPSSLDQQYATEFVEVHDEDEKASEELIDPVTNKPYPVFEVIEPRDSESPSPVSRRRSRHLLLTPLSPHPSSVPPVQSSLNEFRGSVEAFWPAVRSSYEKFIEFAVDRPSRPRSVHWNPVFGRVMDSRMMALMTSVVKFVFQKRLRPVSDTTLQFTCYLCIAILIIQFNRSKTTRRMLLNGGKAMVLSGCVVVFFVCFLELNLRKHKTRRNWYPIWTWVLEKLGRLTGADSESPDSSRDEDSNSTSSSQSPTYIRDFLE